MYIFRGPIGRLKSNKFIPRRHFKNPHAYDYHSRCIFFISCHNAPKLSEVYSLSSYIYSEAISMYAIRRSTYPSTILSSRITQFTYLSSRILIFCSVFPFSVHRFVYNIQIADLSITIISTNIDVVSRRLNVATPITIIIKMILF